MPHQDLQVLVAPARRPGRGSPRDRTHHLQEAVAVQPEGGRQGVRHGQLESGLRRVKSLQGRQGSRIGGGELGHFQAGHGPAELPLADEADDVGGHPLEVDLPRQPGRARGRHAKQPLP
eukprot:10454478-Lingulodinium_polyedra.AAC.2